MWKLIRVYFDENCKAVALRESVEYMYTNIVILVISTDLGGQCNGHTRDLRHKASWESPNRGLHCLMCQPSVQESRKAISLARVPIDVGVFAMGGVRFLRAREPYHVMLGRGNIVQPRNTPSYKPLQRPDDWYNESISSSTPECKHTSHLRVRVTMVHMICHRQKHQDAPHTSQGR